jgi:isopenicillin-N N-acyltransferase-like protein
VTPGLDRVTVAGRPREIGRGHGEEMRAAIAAGLERWFEVVGGDTGIAGEPYVTSFLEATDFLKAIDYFAPALIEEVRGIAEGASQRFDTMLAYQMMDEEWAYRVALMRTRRSSVEACSAAGVVRGDGTSLLAQNMDLPSHYDGSQILLHARPADGTELMAFGPAGLIGTTGLNVHGVGVCVNALFQLRHRSAGLPVGFVIRGVLAQQSAADAVSLLKTVPHATGQNYMVGGPGELHDFECSPGQVREVRVEGSQVTHTNHVLASTDIDPAVEADHDSTTVARLGRLRSELGDLGEKASIEDLTRVLSDSTVPVCVPRGSSWMTLGSVVMELSAEPVLHIAPGPPANTPYSTVGFT